MSRDTGRVRNSGVVSYPPFQTRFAVQLGNTSMGSFAAPLFVLSLDETGSIHRVLSVLSGDKKFVAMFTGESAARDWIAENAPRNTVLRPIMLETRNDVIGFLNDLISNGVSDVCVDPTKHRGNVTTVGDLLGCLE